MRAPIPVARVEQALRTAVAFLSACPGVRRIWVFGSVAKGRPLDWRSDLDLAVEGLAAVEHAGVWARLDETVDLPVELVRWEEANPTLRSEIRRWGRVVYEPDLPTPVC